MKKELDVKVSYEEKVSKNGNPYTVIVIRFRSGYTLQFFPNNDQKFIIEQFCKSEEN